MSFVRLSLAILGALVCLGSSLGPSVARSAVIATPVVKTRANVLAMGGAVRFETSTSALATEPQAGVSLALGRRFGALDGSIEYLQTHRPEVGNQTFSMGSVHREVLAYLDGRIAPFSSETFRTGLGLGAGAHVATARVRFMNEISESTSQVDLLLKAGLSLQYLLGQFQLGADGRLHYSRGTSERIMPEVLLRIGARF